MQLLKDRILKDGIVKPGNILKVDSFLNHQMDITLINEIGKEFKRRFADCPITKILTIEASGFGGGTDLYCRGNCIFMLSCTGRDTGIPDASAGTKRRQENPSGADAVPVETPEFYMEILSSKPVPLQETYVYDSFRNCRKYGTDAGRLRNPGFNF